MDDAQHLITTPTRKTTRATDIPSHTTNPPLTPLQETLNYWKQLPHILKYFRAEEDPTAHLPKNFMSGFLEGRN